MSDQKEGLVMKSNDIKLGKMIAEDLWYKWGSNKTVVVLGGTMGFAICGFLFLSHFIPNDPIELKGEE